MKISQHTATYAIFNAMRTATSNMQSELVRLQHEAVTGKLHDGGLVLGARSENLVSFKSEIANLERIMDTNGLVKSRLEMTQVALGQLNTMSDELVSTLALTLDDETQTGVVVTTTTNALSQIANVLNTEAAGIHLFAGLNTDTPPLTAHDGGSGEAAFDAAFLGYFGFAKTDAAAAGITGAQMTDFLENVLRPQITGAGWAASYSSATDETVQARISDDVTTSASVSANENGIRELMLASVAARELFAAPLTQEARDAAAIFSISAAKSAGDQITTIQARTGLIESQIEKQDASLTSQKDVLTSLSVDLEGVDQYEATTRLNALINQIEASYATTARLQQMSILRYL